MEIHDGTQKNKRSCHKKTSLLGIERIHENSSITRTDKSIVKVFLGNSMLSLRSRDRQKPKTTADCHNTTPACTRMNKRRIFFLVIPVSRDTVVSICESTKWWFLSNVSSFILGKVDVPMTVNINCPLFDPCWSVKTKGNWLNV